MRNTYLAVGIIVVVLVIIAFMIVRNRLPQFRVAKEGPTPTPAVEVASSSATQSISASLHTPASTAVVDSVTLDKPGFVAIHENQNGSPGQILGVTDLLPAGTHQNVTIALTRKTVTGETLFAIVHTDNGDGTFGSEDQESKQENGPTVMTQFQVSSAAESFQIPATGLGEDDR